MGAVLVDYQSNGWAKRNESRIMNDYSEILYVGELQGLDRDSDDSAVSKFCIDNGCDLLTADKTAYVSWLKNGLTEGVHISMLDRDQRSGQFLYIIRTAQS